MTLAINANRTQITSVASLRLSNAIEQAVAVFAAWNDARQTYKALSKLSDYQLEDIGLTRGDLDDFAAR